MAYTQGIPSYVQTALRIRNETTLNTATTKIEPQLGVSPVVMMALSLQRPYTYLLTVKRLIFYCSIP